jgi:hypothetical protein
LERVIALCYEIDSDDLIAVLSPGLVLLDHRLAIAGVQRQDLLDSLVLICRLVPELHPNIAYAFARLDAIDTGFGRYAEVVQPPHPHPTEIGPEGEHKHKHGAANLDVALIWSALVLCHGPSLLMYLLFEKRVARHTDKVEGFECLRRLYQR